MALWMIGLLDFALGSLKSFGPVYSAMDVDVMEEAVEPLSQSLSVARLELRLRPGNDSTESPR